MTSISRSTRSLSALVTVVALFTATACGARFDRPTGAAAYVDPGSGLVVVDPGASGPGAPGAGGLPGASATAGPGAARPGAPGVPGVAGPTGSALPSAGRTSGPQVVEPGSRTGVTATEIRIGYLIPLSGSTPLPPQVRNGIEAYWKFLNERGGIHGRRVRVTVYDTESDEAKAKAAAQRLIDDGNFLAAALDRPGVQGQLGEYLNRAGVPNVQVQTPVGLSSRLEWTFGVTIDHGVQAGAMAAYFRKVLGARKVAVVYQRDPTLGDGVRAFRAAAQAQGLEVVYERSIEEKGNDFSGEASDLLASGATVTWLYMTPEPAAKLANQADAIGYHPTWFANSISWNFDLIFGVAPKAMRGAKAFSPWPPLSDPRTAVYREQYARQNNGEPALDLGIPGWGIGQVLAAALRDAGRDLGRNGFRHAMQNLRMGRTSPVDGGPLLWLPLAFGPGVRQGGNAFVTLRENGSSWSLEADYRTGY